MTHFVVLPARHHEPKGPEWSRTEQVAEGLCGHDDSLTVELNRPHDRIEIVLDLHRPVGKRGGGDAAAAEDAVELVLIAGVVGDCRGWVFQLMASEDADDPLIGVDDALLAE